MREVTPEMIDDIFSEDVADSALLCTISSSDLPEPFRVCNRDGGVESRGEFYEYFPFTFALPGSSDSEVIREAKLEIFNRDKRLSNAIRTVSSDLRVTVEYVRMANPDFVELALKNAKVYGVEIDDPKVTATLRSRTYSTEPACKARYVAARTPGLF